MRRHLLCAALFVAVALTILAQQNWGQSSGQSSGKIGPPPETPTITTLPPPPPFATGSVAPDLHRMPPDIVYEALHDPWFERSPWGSSTSAKAPPEARKKFENGYRHWNSRDWSKAEYDLREAVRLYPEYARAWDVLGRSLQEQKRFEDANLAFQKAQSSDSDYLPAAIGLLEVNNARGTNALDLAKTCLDWEKKASASTSAAQLKAGAQPLSTPSLAFRLFLRSERLRSLIAVSRAYMVGGDPNRALEVGHEAYLLSPLSLDVAILMTDILIFSHDRDQAKSLLERYLKMPVSRHDKQKARERLQALAQPNGSL